jgi:hypothetical protein
VGNATRVSPRELWFGKNDVLDQTHRGLRTPDETGWGAASSLGCVLRLHGPGYLIRQFEAGVSNGDDEGSVRLPAANVDAAQIFDTWAGVLPAGEFRKWCIEPSASIVAAVPKEECSASSSGEATYAYTITGALQPLARVSRTMRPGAVERAVCTEEGALR